MVPETRVLRVKYIKDDRKKKKKKIYQKQMRILPIERFVSDCFRCRLSGLDEIQKTKPAQSGVAHNFP